MLLYNSTAIFIRQSKHFSEHYTIFEENISNQETYDENYTPHTRLTLRSVLPHGRRIHHQSIKEYTYTPKDLGLEYSEDSVMTSDGYRIHIWNLPG